MKYACVLALAAILGVATANPSAAQDRGRSDGEVVVRDRGEGRGESGNGRGRSNDRVERDRDRTGDVERRSSGRTVEDILNGRRAGDSDDRRERRRGDDDDWDDRRRGNDDWEDRRRGDDDDWDDDDWDDDDYRDRRDRRDRRGGPAFCRSGQGHPVFGRQWCRDKGFGLGGRYVDDIWERRRVDDIFFPSRRNDRYMSGSVLEQILGDVFYSRLGSYARSMRADGPIRGRWNGDSELRIYADGTPFARLVDQNGDRRADVIYLRK